MSQKSRTRKLSSERIAEREIELVWTGPSSTMIATRKTEQALLQVIDSASSRLFITSLVAYDVDSIMNALECTSENVQPKRLNRGGVPVQFTVGLKLKGKTDHIAVDAEDALIAALKVKTEHPTAVITYVRQKNRRGDARHPSHGLAEQLSDEQSAEDHDVRSGSQGRLPTVSSA
jgi:hypothetical protein